MSAATVAHRSMQPEGGPCHHRLANLIICRDHLHKGLADQDRQDLVDPRNHHIILANLDTG